MKNILILLAGGMMGYGVFLLVKRKNASDTAAGLQSGMPASSCAGAPIYTATETTEYLPAYAAMLGHFDARPEATFAPPKAYVAVQGVNSLLTNSSWVK